MGTITDSCVVRGAHIEGIPSNWEVNEKVMSDQPCMEAMQNESQKSSAQNGEAIMSAMQWRDCISQK